MKYAVVCAYEATGICILQFYGRRNLAPQINVIFDWKIWLHVMPCRAVCGFARSKLYYSSFLPFISSSFVIRRNISQTQHNDQKMKAKKEDNSNGNGEKMPLNNWTTCSIQNMRRTQRVHRNAFYFIFFMEKMALNYGTTIFGILLFMCVPSWVRERFAYTQNVVTQSTLYLIHDEVAFDCVIVTANKTECVSFAYTHTQPRRPLARHFSILVPHFVCCVSHLVCSQSSSKTTWNQTENRTRVHSHVRRRPTMVVLVVMLGIQWQWQSRNSQFI